VRYKIVMSVILVLAVLGAWYVTHEETATTTQQSDQGISIN
jgi:hypothetical protein